MQGSPHLFELLVQGGAAFLELVAALHMAALELVGFLVEVVALLFAHALLLFFPILEVALHLVAMASGPVVAGLFVEGMEFLVEALEGFVAAAL